MSSTFWIWPQFFALVLVIGFAGYHLSYYADQISDRTGLGRNWIGLILLATVTSLPELIAGISAVTVANSPDLAVGNILGGCVLNLTLVFVLDLLHKESSIYTKVGQAHLLTGALGIILLGVAGFGIAVGTRFLAFNIAHMGGFTLAIPFLYALAIRTLYGFENQGVSAKTPAGTKSRTSSKVYIYFALTALVLVVAAAFLPMVAGRITEVMGWNAAFVGTLFAAIATSLPEAVVTISAIRLKAVELAFSNVLGSNLFNIVILSVDDAFYREGPLFQHVSATHAITAFSGVMMTGLVLVALIQPPQKRILNTVSGMSLLLLLVYLLNAYIVFSIGG